MYRLHQNYCCLSRNASLPCCTFLHPTCTSWEPTNYMEKSPSSERSKPEGWRSFKALEKLSEDCRFEFRRGHRDTNRGISWFFSVPLSKFQFNTPIIPQPLPSKSFIIHQLPCRSEIEIQLITATEVHCRVHNSPTLPPTLSHTHICPAHYFDVVTHSLKVETCC